MIDNTKKKVVLAQLRNWEGGGVVRLVRTPRATLPVAGQLRAKLNTFVLKKFKLVSEIRETSINDCDFPKFIYNYCQGAAIVITRPGRQNT